VLLRTATAQSLKKYLNNAYSHGVPKVVITDSGVKFANRIFKSFLTEMGFRQKFTARRKKTEQSKQTMIARFAEQNHRNWGEKWAELFLEMNTNIGVFWLYSIVSDPKQRVTTLGRPV